MKNKSYFTGCLDIKAFTLIELLVVVLIIGILASVALPQYQKAVEKSRAAAVWPLLRAIGEAQENYYLANGVYANSFDDLAVEIPFTGTTKWSTASYLTDTRSNNDWSIQLYPDTVHAVFAGRLTGPYAGSGFAYYFGDWACPPPANGLGVCAHTMTCVVKSAGAGGVTVDSAKSLKYCRQIFKATQTVQSGDLGNYYLVP
ncbi:type IV pilin protein [Candidatus Avelusimicrobium luingense]|uniref:type IV pilin protein n=1 Tax=Candidatus Avelusimicrobium luingense TaxID=3416211 RepID=UPI003D0F10D7